MYPNIHVVLFVAQGKNRAPEINRIFLHPEPKFLFSKRKGKPQICHTKRASTTFPTRTGQPNSAREITHQFPRQKSRKKHNLPQPRPVTDETDAETKGGREGGIQDLVGGDGPAGVVPPDGVYESPDAGAAAVAPEEVVAGGLDEELVLAGRDRRRDERGRVRHVAVGGGAGEPGADGAVDAEDEEDEDERGEELQRRRPAVAPGERGVLAEQRAVLLPRERAAAQELHRGPAGIVAAAGRGGEFLLLGWRALLPVALSWRFPGTSLRFWYL